MELDVPIFAARRIDDAWLISAPSDDPFLPAWITVATARPDTRFIAQSSFTNPTLPDLSATIAASAEP
jgi:hypothetical protein